MLQYGQDSGRRGRVGRTKLYHENVRLPLKEGTKDRVEAVLRPGEDRTDFYRQAVYDELDRRELEIRNQSKGSALEISKSTPEEA